MEIAKRLSIPSSTTSSFTQEIRDLLEARCRLAYGIGFMLSITSWMFYQFILDVKPRVVDTPLADWQAQIYALFAVAFGLALIPILSRRASITQLLLIDHIVMVFTVLLAAFAAAVFMPAVPPYGAIALILFVHAAFIPVQTKYQLGLAVWATLGYPIAMLAARAYLPGIVEFWAANGGSEAFRFTVLEGSFSLGMFGFVSVLITHSLYGMRKSLHDAKRMGNYIIQREIGSGGMGQVFRAQHALLFRPTAIKTLRSDDASEAAANLARFEREVRLSATLSHPNTITIYDFGRTEEETFYYAMEYLEGLDLQALVERFGPLSPERAVYILKQACGSLNEAHSREIIHRDIKPSNIFLTHRGGLYDFVKVLDFGLAKQVETPGASALTKTGVLFGTPRYLAPESVYGPEEVDARSDLYNLGGVAYWVLTGQPPFSSESSVEVIIDHVKTAPTPPSQVSEVPIPADLEAIVMKCLEKKPVDRFQSAAEIEEALDRIPFSPPWGQAAAREWWSLHAIDDARIAECCAVATPKRDSLSAPDAPVV